MYESLLRFPMDVLPQFDRLRREMDQLFGWPGVRTSIRAAGRGAFPAINVGGTVQALEVYAFAPGVDPGSLEITVDANLLTIAGERKGELPEESDTVSVYGADRYSGSFKRVVSLPQDVDPTRVEARQRDGVVRITIQRRTEAQPRHIEIK
jgi:HSP20 family protein